MSKPDATATPSLAEPSTHDVAVKMQIDFAQTGAFQGADLNRILGDPAQSVSYFVSPQRYVETVPRSDWLSADTSCSSYK